jgi:hypothetical protein
MFRHRRIFLTIALFAAACGGQQMAFADTGGVSAGDGKSAGTVPSTEAMEKLLAALKAQREQAASAYAKDDPRLRVIDQEILLVTAEIDAGDARTAEDIAADTKRAAAQMARNTKDGLDALRVELSRETAAEQALRNKTVTLAYEKSSLEKVLDSIRDQTRCNMSINWDTMGMVGIEANTPVTVRLTDVSYEKALKEVLNAASQSITDPLMQLDFVVDEGVVCIGTREDLQSARFQHVRMYNVSDLLEPEKAGSMTWKEKQEARDDRVKALEELLKNTVAIDSWRDNQGNIGIIRDYDGVLVILQTTRNHQEIVRFLALLRVARDAKDASHRETK